MPPLLLAVPNVSEGRDARIIETIGDAFASAGVTRLDTHSDPDHNRSVYTLVGRPGAISDSVLNGARATVQQIDVAAPADQGQHPHVGALDVAPVVYLEPGARGAACAEALVIADRIGSELRVPVFLYGELAGGRTRAELRRGGVRGLSARMAACAGAAPGGGESTQQPVSPDFGPARVHPSAGATLVAAREPLVAFNVCLGSPAGIHDARAIAAAIREGGREGLPGVRAIGVLLGDGRAQVSLNIEQPLQLPLVAVVQAVARHAPVESAELVGLAPAVTLEGFPTDLPLVGFDPERHVIENALGSYRGPDEAQAKDQAPR
jgi:glutamate formiminotransferase/glutamate formiminotransferase/formiminotetrahydrofolate cyclodeaminase